MQSTKRIWTCAYYLSTYIRDIDQKKTKYMCVRERKKQIVGCQLFQEGRRRKLHLFVGEWMILSIERVIRMSGEEVSFVFVLQKNLTQICMKTFF